MKDSDVQKINTIFGIAFFVIAVISYLLNNPVERITLITSVVSTSSFIGLFFFTFGAVLEKMSLEKQISNLVSILTKVYVHSIPSPLKQILKKYVSEHGTTEHADADAKVAKSNQLIFKKAIKSLGYLAILGVILVAIIVMVNKISILTLKTIAVHLFFTLIFVCITYAITAFSVGLNYTSADPNYVKRQVVKALKLKIAV